jgi:hypothetical protein
VQHKNALLNFLQEFVPWLHALELNGLRSRRENREVLEPGEALLIDKFRWIIGLVANPILQPALKPPFLGNEEGGL